MQPAVGEHTVDVEDREAYAARARIDVFHCAQRFLREARSGRFTFSGFDIR
jgi:hypothetical protein